MVLPLSSARHGLSRAVARLAHVNVGSSSSTVAVSGRRSVSSVATSRHVAHQQQLRRSLSRTGPAVLQQLQQQQQQRWLSSGGGKEDDSDDDFKPKRKAVSDDPDEISGLIKKQVESNPVMLYMKGTPAEPRCGFSSQVVRILHMQGVSFSSVNVLDYPALREGIKNFSEWPTIPQVFVKGEFVGGCDIVSQMHESGELGTMFKEAKLAE